MARLLLDNDSRKLLFENLKIINSAATYKKLAEKLHISWRGLKKWRHGERLIPGRIIPQDIYNKLNVIYEKADNWGAVKGGRIGIRRLFEKYGKDRLRKWRSDGGKKAWRSAIEKLENIKKSDPERFYFLLRETKLKKNLNRLITNSKNYDCYFKNNIINFDSGGLEYSDYDRKRGLCLPSVLTKELAEEIGIHAGDGTLSTKKYYYSVRGDQKEEDYYVGFILPLYKSIYGINLPLLKRGVVCGFEVSSRALYEFKSKCLGLPVGEKVGRIDVPDCIFESKNREIMQAFLRGIFDTDGCVYFSKKRRYPRIQITIKSRRLIKNIDRMLRLLGFVPATSIRDCRTALNGTIMLRKWIEDIGSHNPKHIGRIEKIKLMLPWSSLDRLLEEEQSQ